MNEFLSFLSSNNIPYLSIQFRDILDDPNVHNELIMQINNLRDLLEESDPLNILLKVSSNIGKDISPYALLFLNFELLLDNLNTEYDEKLLKQKADCSNKNVEKVINDIKATLQDIRSKMESIGLTNA